MAGKKKKQESSPTSEALRDLEESSDRVAEWASENAALILGAFAAILLLAGGVGLYSQAAANERDEAADALAVATSQYRQAMGADPISGGIPEPANPELAEQTRREYIERFAAVAEEHSGTDAGALAWLETGKLQTELGRLEEAATSFGRARDEAKGSTIAALGSLRLAALAEDRKDPASAAAAYEAAGAIEAYPLRAAALADAARCWAEAGDADRAFSVFQRVESEFPDDAAAPQIRALIAELRLTQ